LFPPYLPAASLPNTTVVPLPQLDRVRDLLLSMLALTEPIGALSSDLKRLEPGRTLVVHPILGAKVTGPTTLRTFGLGRALRDQFRAARKGENWLRKVHIDVVVSLLLLCCTRCAYMCANKDHLNSSPKIFHTFIFMRRGLFFTAAFQSTDPPDWITIQVLANILR